MYTVIKKWAHLFAGIFFFLIIGLKLSAQPSDLQPTFTGKNGLPSSSINQIIKDNDGRIWIATENGISIKNTYDSRLLELEKSIISPVKQIAFTSRYIYIALGDGLNIYDSKKYNLLKFISSDQVGAIRKLRIINDTAWILTNKSIFHSENLLLKSIPRSVNRDFPFDIALFQNKIYVITYPSSSLLVYDGKSFVESELTAKVNPKRANNYLTIKALSDTLILGGDHLFCYFIQGKPPKIILKDFLFRPDSNPAIFDMINEGNRIFLAVGNTHLITNGGLMNPFMKNIHQKMNNFYSQCLFFDKNNDALWIGTMNDGIYILKNVSKTFYSGKYTFVPSNQINQYYLINGKEIRKINYSAIDHLEDSSKLFGKYSYSVKKVKSINGTSYVMTMNSVFSLTGGKPTYIWGPYGSDSARFFTDCFILADSLYCTILYNHTNAISLKTHKCISYPTETMIPRAEKGLDKIIIYNQGKGFTIIDKNWFHKLESKPYNLNNIDDFTCVGDTLYVLKNKIVLKFLITGNEILLKNKYSIDEIIDGFSPNWILHSNSGILYLISNDAILNWKDGIVNEYFYLGKRIVSSKPEFDQFGRLLFNTGGYVTILNEKQLFEKTNWPFFSINIPDKLSELTSGTITLLNNDYFAENYSLKRLSIHKDGKIVYQKSFTGSSIQLPPIFKHGQYKVSVYSVNQLIAQQNLDITLPLNRNPWFFVFVGLLVLFFSFLVFKLKYNQKVYAKRIMDNKVEMLQKNLNPHFIFNSLNLIYSNILDENKDIALSVLMKFSKLQRNFMERSREKYVTLTSELSFIQSYLDIEFLRYSRDIKIDSFFNISPEIDPDKVHIPPNILQPLMENALKYGAIGYEGDEERLIKIDIFKKDSAIVLTIENPSEHISNKNSLTNGTGMGLLIVKERIELFNQEMGTALHLKADLPAKQFKKGYRVELIIA